MSRINGITIIAEHNNVVLGIVDDMHSDIGIAYVIAYLPFAMAHHFERVSEPTRDYMSAHRAWLDASAYEA